MSKIFLILICTVASVYCETNWVQLARLVNPTGYFTELMQETMHEVERREWCNLKLLDIHQTLDEVMYHWHVSGEVRYTNGFLISIQKIDLSNLFSDVSARTVDGNSTVVAWANGMLNLRDVNIGYDAVVNLTDEDEQRYTGVFSHTLIQLLCTIERNLITNTMTSSCGLSNLSGSVGARMIYMPSNNVTEVLSRRYVTNGIWDSVVLWGREIIAPIMLEVSTNKIAFPEVCYSNC